MTARLSTFLLSSTNGNRIYPGLWAAYLGLVAGLATASGKDRTRRKVAFRLLYKLFSQSYMKG